MKKGKNLLIFLILVGILQIQFALGSFICGSVKDAQEFSAAGLEVSVYYSEAINQKTNCRVSSAENKYCCDLESISNVTWKAGKIAIGEIFDVETGYVAGPVNLAISGGGFDVLPEMNLQKVITVHSPIQKVFINASKILINISTIKDYNKLNYSLIYNNETIEKNKEICTDCNNAAIALKDLSYGTYQLEISANGKKEMKEKINFVLLESLNFKREMKCSKCRSDFVPSDTDVNVSLYLRTSPKISGILTDYFPNDWELKSGGESKDYSPTHKSIEWAVENGEAAKSYALHSPKIIIPRKYSFQSKFNEMKIKEDKIRVGIFNFPFFSLSQGFSQEEFRGIFHRASSSVPLILKPNNAQISLIAIYPKKEFIKAFAKINVEDQNRRFEIISNIGNSEIIKVLVRFKLPKSLNYKEVYLQKEKGEERINVTKIEENKNSIFYSVYLKETGKFRIITE